MSVEFIYVCRIILILVPAYLFLSSLSLTIYFLWMFLECKTNFSILCVCVYCYF